MPRRFWSSCPTSSTDARSGAGTLGCPLCDRRFTLRDGVLDTGGAPPPDVPHDPTRLSPDALVPLIGLGGPGGYLVLVGPPAAGWRELAERMPGVALVAVNPPGMIEDDERLSVLRGARLALKSRSMRGVALGAPYGGDPQWVEEAARVVLPGLRVVGEGPEPPPDRIDLMASAGGVWVGSPPR